MMGLIVVTVAKVMVVWLQVTKLRSIDGCWDGCPLPPHGLTFPRFDFWYHSVFLFFLLAFLPGYVYLLCSLVGHGPFLALFVQLLFRLV